MTTAHAALSQRLAQAAPSQQPTTARGTARRGWRHTRAWLTAAAAASALVISGCSANLPTDAVPRAGLPVDVQARQDVQRLLPRPQSGASTTDVVTGFLRANVGFAEDDDVARDYLTSSLASDWVPTSNVLVLEGVPEVRSIESGVVQVTAEVRGRIDGSGRLIEQPAGTTTTQSFQLTPVAGEWRINAFPEGFGLWLSATDLDQAFRPTTVYYVNPLLETFVPEVRWLAKGEGLTTSVTRAQLSPPPSYLEGAVSTGATGDVQLAVGAVPVDPTTQVATVNLQATGLAEDSERLRILRAQLTHALLGLSGVNRVDLRVVGRSVDSEPIGASADLGFHDAYLEADVGILRVQDRLITVSPTDYALRNVPAPEDSPGLPNLGIAWSGVAASADGATLAAVNTTRTELWRWRGDNSDVNPGIGDRLTDPSFSPDGLLWVAGAARSSGVPRVWWSEAEDIKAVARPIDIPNVDDTDRVTAFRVSPDGSRALLVIGPSAGDGPDRLMVAGIIRGPQGRPTGLATPYPVAPTLVDIASARWAPTGEIVAVASRSQDVRLLPYRVPLGGWVRQVGDELPGLVDLLAVPEGQGYRPVARTEDGRFHTVEGSGWYEARNGDELIIPGS
ncbi:LpqB family beta-propeller domain-containing protein [Ornithinimicrobium sp. Y1847]|uniref:LpqB family beta-propeller domain-containing protein n=1 Tax=unclassified Ornithinimicrobium TaxID=2615080 RepID=UPI003B674906